MNTISILINLFIGFYIITNNNISYPFIQLFNNNIFKIIILFIMIIVNKPILSLLIGISYIITTQKVNESFNCLCGASTKYPKEKFGNCLCGSKVKETDCPIGQNLIHVHGLKPFCGDPKLHLS